MQLFNIMEENGDICLDSGNVTMLLTYCDSKTKSERSLGKFKEYEWHWSWRLLSSQMWHQCGREVLMFWGNLLLPPPTL